MTDTVAETIRSVSNALRVMEAFKPNESIGVSELARRVELPKTTTQRILQTLQAAGWVAPGAEPPTRWGPSVKFLAIGSRLSQGWGLREVATPVLNDLRNRTEETVNLVVPQGDHVVYLYRVESPQLIRASASPGALRPITQSSGGKAILAEMPEAEVRKLLGPSLPRQTEHTIVDVNEMIENLNQARKLGFAVSWKEWHLDVIGVAAAIKDGRGTPVAAISLVIPAARATRSRVNRELGPQVAKAAATISQGLQATH